MKKGGRTNRQREERLFWGRVGRRWSWHNKGKKTTVIIRGGWTDQQSVLG